MYTAGLDWLRKHVESLKPWCQSQQAEPGRRGSTVKVWAGVLQIQADMQVFMYQLLDSRICILYVLTSMCRCLESTSTTALVHVHLCTEICSACTQTYRARSLQLFEQALARFCMYVCMSMYVCSACM